MTPTLDLTPIIDVDSHVVEPRDLWTSRMPSKYGDKIPQVVWDGDADEHRWKVGSTLPRLSWRSGSSVSGPPGARSRYGNGARSTSAPARIMQTPPARISRRPGRLAGSRRKWWPGWPGESNEEIYGTLVGLGQGELDTLRADGVI